jgi:membrane protease YdiL (CAAX protease family)
VQLVRATSVRVALFYAGCLLLLLSASAMAKPLAELQQVSLIGAVCSGGAWLLSGVFVHWDGLDLASIGTKLTVDSGARFGLGFALGLLLIGLHASALLVLGHTSFERNPSAQPSQIAWALLGYGLLASREELAFHGYPLRRLAASFGRWPALIVVGFVFALEHVAGGAGLFAAIAGACVGSMLFGIASLTTRGLAIPIGIHAAWNFGDWMRSSGGKFADGPRKPVVEAGFDSRAEVVGWSAYVVLMLGTAVAFWWWERRQQRFQT